jgi:hypothetical protein
VEPGKVESCGGRDEKLSKVDAARLRVVRDREENSLRKFSVPRRASPSDDEAARRLELVPTATDALAATNCARTSSVVA